MSSRCRDAVVRAGGALALATALGCNAAPELRVCADPHDLPYSSADARGFENRIAELVAHDLGRTVRYYWQPQWRGYARKTLLAGHCDVIPGIPAAERDVLATQAYYRGTYAFVYAAQRFPALTSFDDPRLRRSRIGVQIVGIDAIATPAGQALARRGIVANVVGFPVMGERPSAARMIDALADGSLDVAIVWSPQPGYFIAQRGLAYAVVPIEAAPGDPSLEFAIAMGVRPGDIALQQALNGALARLRPRIDAVLRDYAVTRVQPESELAGLP
jgi:mxaJ protein